MFQACARIHKLATVATLLIAALVCIVPVAAWSAASDASPQVALYPPGAHPHGHTLGEWSAAWWQWAISMPITANPLMETADCNAGQAGPVWFLGGSFVNATTTRECSIPAGMAILVPVLNTECSTAESDPFHGDNEAELRACAMGFIDATAGLFATIDGRPVQNLADYRAQSPLYNFNAPDNNVLFVPGPVSGQSVSDGVWLFMPPLSAGNHTLHFGGTFTGFSLTLDVTYNITVVPGGRGRSRVAGSGGEIMIESTAWGLLKTLYR